MHEVITHNLDLWTSALLTKPTAGRGSNGKQEAYGIKKLRELTLGTALRGLFAEKTESLPETIEQDISNAKHAHYKSVGRKSKEYVFGPPLLEEFTLPVGWIWKRVGELCDLQTGATPSTNRPEYFGGKIRWLVSGDINQGIIDDCDGRITEQGLANSNCKVLPPKTVLIALNGQGKTRASVALLNVPAACNQSLVGMIPFGAAILDPMFLLLSLRYRYYEIRDITGQDQRRGLNMGLVAELSIPLPPISEQHRIVAKVGELMALCDQLEQQQTHSLEAHQILVETLLGTLTRVASQQEFIEAWTRIASHLDTLFTTELSIDQLKQTILQLAVMGKLVPQDHNDEPAGELLARIQMEQQKIVTKGKIKNEKALSSNAGEEEPFELPDGWKWSRLDGITLKITDGEHLSPQKTQSGMKLLTAKHVLDNGITLDDPQYVSFDDGIRFRERCDPRTGDVLICSRGTIGRCCAIEVSEEFCLMGSVILVRAFPQIAPRYLGCYFKSEAGQFFIRGATKGMAVNALYLKDIKLCPIPIPPSVEQHRIVAKVDELMALCDVLEARIKDAQTTQIHLADAIVEQAVA